jgi:hypothetical protein
MESRAILQQLLVTPNAQELRCCKLLIKLKACQPNWVWIFSNDKIFTGDVVINCHNSLSLTDLLVANMDPSIWISPISKAPLKQMVLGEVGSNSQNCSIVFIDYSEQVNADVYQDLLRQP